MGSCSLTQTSSVIAWELDYAKFLSYLIGEVPWGQASDIELGPVGIGVAQNVFNPPIGACLTTKEAADIMSGHLRLVP